MLRYAAVCACLAGACAGAPPAPTETASDPDRASAPASPAPAEQEPAEQEPVRAVDCGAEIRDAAAVLVPGAIVMLGEMHGTAEIPAFAGDLACRAAARGHRVLLGLEIPSTEQEAIDRYLASDGSTVARDALLAGAHWQAACPDGRSSQAMLALVERVRRLRRDGLGIDVFAFDSGTYDDWNRRDASMAETILARAAGAPEALVLTLSGNLHNRLVPGLPWDDSKVPMGVHVAAAHERVISLDVRYAGGTAWIQRSEDECGATELSGKPAYRDRYVEIGDGAGNPVGTGVFSVGAVTAAAPARASR
ncbi:hypothetical protein [Haliangium sp.]|uniref:hypothetical protein n=1 Tax=Haliangium sp. TaxID=2663208 RepID=UPI003D0D8389